MNRRTFSTLVLSVAAASSLPFVRGVATAQAHTEEETLRPCWLCTGTLQKAVARYSWDCRDCGAYYQQSAGGLRLRTPHGLLTVSQWQEMQEITDALRAGRFDGTITRAIERAIRNRSLHY